MSFDGSTYFLKTQKHAPVNWHWHFMDLHTSWRYKGRIFRSVNYHRHLIDSHTSWRHKSRIFLSVDCYWRLMDLHTSWRHKGSIFWLVNTIVVSWIHIPAEDTIAALIYLWIAYCPGLLTVCICHDNIDNHLNFSCSQSIINGHTFCTHPPCQYRLALHQCMYLLSRGKQQVTVRTYSHLGFNSTQTHWKYT